MDINFWDSWHQPVGVFTFVIILVFIGSFLSYQKQRQKNQQIKEAQRSGQTIDPELLKDLKSDDDDGGGVTAGFILIAVAVGLVFMGYQIGEVSGDSEIFPLMQGVAAIPGLIGVVLIIGGLISKGSRKKG
ncbi:MAG: DUF6249 domain-containing protein [Pseudomonadota bacterium]